MADEDLTANDQPRDDGGRDRGHEQGPQAVTVEDVGPARKCLTIEVPRERIEEKIQAGFSRLQTDASVPGFRRGKAPRRLLEKRFGATLRDDVRGQLLSECYSQAIEDEKLSVIGEPEVQDLEQIRLPETGPLTFKVEVEVTPEFELPDLAGIKVNQTAVSVTDEDIDQEVQRQCRRMGDYQELASGDAVEADDVVKADIEVYPGGDPIPEGTEPLQQHKAEWVHVWGEEKEFKGHVAGIVVGDLGKRLIGAKAGDQVRITTTGPANHEDERIKEQPITVVIRVDSVNRYQPVAAGEVVEQWGLESEDQLKQRLRELLTEQGQREQRLAMHKEVCDHLQDAVQLELPKGLTTRQAARLLHREALQMAYRGMEREEVEQELAKIRDRSQEDAQRHLKLFFILDRAAKSLNIEVSESEVNGRVAVLAAQEGRRPEKMRHEMQQKGQIEHLYLQIREQKTLDKILDLADVRENNDPTPPAGGEPS